MSHKRNASQAKGRAKVLAEKKTATKRAGVLTALKNQTIQLQQAFLNIRTMYDQKVMEVSSLQGKIAIRDRLLTALAVEEPVTITNVSLSVVNSGQFIGFDLDVNEETQDVTITAVAAEANSVVEAAEDEVQMTHFDPAAAAAAATEEQADDNI